MPLQLKFHGALETVTGSCHFFKVKSSGNIYAVDCGAAQGEPTELQLALPRNLPRDCTPDKLSGIILTHAHGDHINYLVHWVQAGFEGQIFCSIETAKLAEIALQDNWRIESQRETTWTSEESLLKTLVALKSARNVQPGSIETLEHNVTIEAVSTSHLLGCCGFRVVARTNKKTCSVFYTGDVGPIENSNETQSLYAARNRPSEGSDFIVTESTYGGIRRKKESQNGRQRLARVCDIIKQGCRHGNNSLVIIPAFSLQRSLDVLVDVFCALQYQRGKTGIDNSVLPLIMIHSNLSWNYAQTYRDFYFAELSNQCFFNKDSLLKKMIDTAGDDDAGVFNDLIPFGRSKTIKRLDDSDEEIATEIIWGKAEEPYHRPTVIICGSGITRTGPITELFDKHLVNPTATFVLSGYVPLNSPGGQLRRIANLPLLKRGVTAIEIPDDPQLQRPAKVIPGDTIKCDFDTLSEYYSGHADGPSVIRYILGDQLERADQTKGIFLVHGDEHAQTELANLIHNSCLKAGKTTPKILHPKAYGLWFDCETRKTNGADFDRTRNCSYSVPELIEIQTCIIISYENEADAAILLLKSAFAPENLKLFREGVLIKLGTQDYPHSTVLVNATKLGNKLLKLLVQTRIMQCRNIEDISAITFDWEKALPLLGASKELYNPKIRWCETSIEVNQLLAICTTYVFRKRTRRQPVLLIHKETFNLDQLASIERLFTPAVIVAIIPEKFVSKINTYLQLLDNLALSSANTIYLPIQDKPQAFSVSRGALDITMLCELINLDTEILLARELKLAKKGKCSPLILPFPDPIYEQPVPSQVPTAPTDTIKEKSFLPITLFKELAIGQKVSAIVDRLQLNPTNGTMESVTVFLCINNLPGIIYHSQMRGPFEAKPGDLIDLWVREIKPYHQIVYLTQYHVKLPIISGKSDNTESFSWKPWASKSSTKQGSQDESKRK